MTSIMMSGSIVKNIDVVDREPAGLQKLYPNFLLIMMHTSLHSLRCDRVSVTFRVAELTLTDFGKNQISIERRAECQNGHKILCDSHNSSTTVQYLSTPRRYLERLDRERSILIARSRTRLANRGSKISSGT